MTRDPLLLAYRTIAYVVGVFLPVLLVGAIYGIATAKPGESISKAAGRPTVVEVIGPLHGFLYIVLLLLVVGLWSRERWPIWFPLLVGLAGTIPFLSFVAERAVTRRVRARRSAQPPVAAAPAGAGAASRRR